MDKPININKDLLEYIASLQILCDKYGITIFLQVGELYLYKEGTQYKQAPLSFEGIDFLINYITPTT